LFSSTTTKTDLTEVIGFLNIGADETGGFDIVLLPKLIDVDQTEPNKQGIIWKRKRTKVAIRSLESVLVIALLL
jgi:hypothetical protein